MPVASCRNTARITCDIRRVVGVQSFILRQRSAKNSIAQAKHYGAEWGWGVGGGGEIRRWRDYFSKSGPCSIPSFFDTFNLITEGNASS